MSGFGDRDAVYHYIGDLDNDRLVPVPDCEGELGCRLDDMQWYLWYGEGHYE